jgi:hypothetical protein
VIIVVSEREKRDWYRMQLRVSSKQRAENRAESEIRKRKSESGPAEIAEKGGYGDLWRGFGGGGGAQRVEL